MEHPTRREILLAAAGSHLSDAEKMIIGLDWLGVIIQAANHNPKKRFKPQRLFDVIKSVQDNKQNKQAQYESTVLNGEHVLVRLEY